MGRNGSLGHHPHCELNQVALGDGVSCSEVVAVEPWRSHGHLCLPGRHLFDLRSACREVGRCEVQADGEQSAANVLTKGRSELVKEFEGGNFVVQWDRGSNMLVGGGVESDNTLEEEDESARESTTAMRVMS